MEKLLDFEARLAKIEDRNKKVEIDKGWEVSLTRRVSLMLFTYLSVSLYFVAIGIDRPFLGAVVPTVGFLLSTLSLPFIKRIWLRHKK